MAKTVLVVEDSDETRAMLTRMLHGEGYAPLEARNGVEALEKLGEYSRQTIPIVAITAFDTFGMKEAALEAGCNEYMLKPLDIDKLGVVLRNHLGYI